MKQTKLKIKNVLGIKQLELDGKSIELRGPNGAGKSSVIDAIRKVLSNNFSREVLVTQGETEAEIFLETDTGISIDRKIRTNKGDYLKVKENGADVSSPQTFLNELFTPLQLDPVGFTQLTRQEKNRILLDLIEFKWDINWITEKFGEIPKGIDYSQNILQVLHNIQAKDGQYYKDRQVINSAELHKRKTIEDIAKDIPPNFDATKWENYSVSEKASELTKIQQSNNEIDKAKRFKLAYDDKIKGLQANKMIAVQNEKETIESERNRSEKTIERLKAETKAEEDKLLTLDDKLKDKIAIAEAEYNEQVAKLDGDIKIAEKYIGKEIIDIVPLQNEIAEAERMKNFVNEYKRMLREIIEQNQLIEQSEELTRKIELARELPSEILKTAEMPIADLTVVDGVPLVRNLPIDNLSDGEQLELCVDVSVAKTGNLQIILIDGVERLSSQNRDILYSKCKAKGVQVVATRTTDDSELNIVEL